MISFRNVWFDDPVSEAKIENINFDLATDRHHAILCNNIAEREALVQIISGTGEPDRGEVFMPESVSFPVGTGNVIQMRFSVKNNVKFLARFYGLQAKDLQKFLDAMVGDIYNPSTPISKLPYSERTSILLALSYAVPFKYYIANVFALPLSDAPGFDNLQHYLEYLREQKRGLLLVTGALGRAMDVCKSASILDNGELIHFDVLEEAAKAFYEIRQVS